MKHLKYPFHLFLLLSLFLNLNTNAQVGIGTNNPQAKLHIAGDLQVEDLSGQGERPLIATPEGKLRAITPNSSETTTLTGDTLKAQFIRLIDEAGNTKMILNAHTGEFQMIDDDIVWYQIQASNSIVQTTQTTAGVSILITDETTITSLKEQMLTILQEKLAEQPEQTNAEALTAAIADLQNNSTVQIEASLVENATDATTLTSGSYTFYFTGSEDRFFIQINLQQNESNTFDITLLNIQTVEIKTTPPSNSATSNDLQISASRSARAQTITVVNTQAKANNTPVAEVKNDAESNTFENKENNTSNNSTSDQTTINGSDTSISIGDNDFSNPSSEDIEAIAAATGQDIAVVTANFLDQTDGNESNGAPVKDIVESVQRVNDNTQAIENTQQNTQNNHNAISNIINQTAANSNSVAGADTLAQDLAQQIDDFQNNSGGSEAIGTLFTVSEENSNHIVGPEGSTVTDANGITYTITKDGILIDDGNEQLFIDCFGVSKVQTVKSFGFAGFGFDADQDKAVIHVDVEVTGTLTELGAKINRADHPNHPTQQYLQHSSIGTDQAHSEYSGTTTTDAQGKATITLPNYIQDYHNDFYYQITPINSLAQVIVGQEINNHQFTIQSSQPNTQVSWQITGIHK